MSTLAREAAEAPMSAARQIATGNDAIEELARRLRARPPSLVVTCARGSSDHAATFGKYLIETTVGCPVASVGPGIASMYGRALRLDGALFIAVSQSGTSPDLVRLSASARTSGAIVVGIINDTSSPLAAECDIVVSQCAGEERAVAATKSFLMSCLALLRVAAAWADLPELRAAVAHAPDALQAACALDWSAPLLPLARATNLYVVGRGIGLSAALEIALKLKETCRLHAEAFSTAELRHGPIALAEAGFPIIAIGQHDQTHDSVRDAIVELERLTHDIASSLPVDGTRSLPTVPGVPAALSPLCQVLSCYLALPALAIARGLDPDLPRHLAKITRTT